jgi:APA family basic amino acid/polyamine antiporter
MVLKRVLGAREAAWLVAGNMIGAGIFITPGLVAGFLPGVRAPLVAWMLGGVLALCGAAVYGELGSRLPRAGGDYQYLQRTFGPLWGFLTGWAALLLSFSGAAAVMAMVAAENLATVWSAAAQSPWLSRTFVAPLLVLMLTIANVAGARFAGRTTAWLTALPVLGLALLFVLGWFHAQGTEAGGGALGLPSPGAALADPNAMGSTFRWDRRVMAALGAAMIPVFFTYSGWNAAAYVAGEIRQPARNLWRGLLCGTLGVTLFYLVFNALLLKLLPRAAMAGSTTAAATAARQLLGSSGEKSLALVVALAVLGSANVTLMAGARIYYAMALDGLAPRRLRHTNAAGVPSTALWASGLWTALLAATGRIETLVNWATLAILLLSSMAVASLFWMRRHGMTPGGEEDVDEPPYRCPGYPWTPLVYLVASLAVAWASVLYDWRQALYGVLIVAAGIPVYGLWRVWQRLSR